MVSHDRGRVAHPEWSRAVTLTSVEAPTRTPPAAVAPRPWVDSLPSLSRWTLRLALEDAILLAQDCADEARERRYLRMLERLEASGA
jgi:hypothetical protein